MLSTFLSLGVIAPTLCDTLLIVVDFLTVNATEMVSAGGGTVDEEGNISVAHAERPASHQRLSFFNSLDAAPASRSSSACQPVSVSSTMEQLRNTFSAAGVILQNYFAKRF